MVFSPIFKACGSISRLATTAWPFNPYTLLYEINQYFISAALNPPQPFFAADDLMLKIRIVFRASVIRTARYPCNRQIVTPRATMDQICVFGATEHELRQAEEHFQRTGPLSSAGKPTAGKVSHPCTLNFQASSTGGDNTAVCGAFDASQYYSALETSSLGRILFTAATTASTQAVVQDNIANLPDGVVFIADKQIGGKGRGGNTWESPPGCLMFSAACRLSISGQRLPFVQYLVTLAVVQAAQAEAVKAIKLALVPDVQIPGAPLDVRIKWPNDVYAGGLKLGGILCHSSFRNNQFHVIMGVGLNLSNDKPTTCINELVAAAAVKLGGSITPPSISREALLAGVMTRLEPMLHSLAEHGFAPFERDYYSAWLHSGQHVVLEEESTAGPVGVTIQGLSPHGYLKAQDDAGQMYELHPDGNSFDFFKGLVRKKLPAA